MRLVEGVRSRSQAPPEVVVGLLLAPSTRPAGRHDERENQTRTGKLMEPTILIAEDDMVSRIALRRRLEGWGYPVVAVADGNAAWGLLQGEKAPPIAILDWTMPEM